MRLFIAEKPELAKAIAEGLGGTARRGRGFIQVGGDTITWCVGHLLQLYDPEDYDPSYRQWSMEQLPMVFRPWRYKPIAKTADQLDVVVDLLKKASSIVHAGDPDAEGQLLVEEVLEYAGNKKPVQRLLINDNNTAVVRRALANMRDNREFRGLYHLALARSVADQLYGYNLTRAYTLAAREKGYTGVLSVGRVQTPILGLVVQRDRLHEAHTVAYYYTLAGQFAVDGLTFNANYVVPEDAPTDDRGRVIDREYLEHIANACNGQSVAVRHVKTEVKERSAPLPYNLLELQADASRKFGLSPDQTLSITQGLRERHRLITYNRSDSQYLSEEQHADAGDVLAAIADTAPALTAAAAHADPKIKSRAFNSANVSAHHAIVPTQNHADFTQLSQAEQQIYLLIARAYIAQFFPKHQLRQSKVELECQGHAFRVTSSVTLRAGWLALYKSDADNEEVHGEEADTSDDLSDLRPGVRGNCTAAEVSQQQTKPPARYTMSSLLKDLARVAKYVKDPRIKKLLLAKDADVKGEQGGIGTPATRSAIINTLLGREYLAEKGKAVISTPLGRDFYDALPEQAVTPDMTALWHEQQKRIEAGAHTVDAFLDELVGYITDEVGRVKREGLALAAVAAAPCPDCGTGYVVRRKGAKGPFDACTRFPECKWTRDAGGSRAARRNTAKRGAARRPTRRRRTAKT